MNTHILKEEEFNNFIQKEVLPLCVDSTTKTLALVGNLGAGKTTFSKHLLKTLGVKSIVSSPTFSIVNSYTIDFSNFKKALHIDVYRVEDSKELEVLHFDEMIGEEKTISIIEWADTIKEKIPHDAVWIYFEHDGVDTRKVTNKNG